MLILHKYINNYICDSTKAHLMDGGESKDSVLLALPYWRCIFRHLKNILINHRNSSNYFKASWGALYKSFQPHTHTTPPPQNTSRISQSCTCNTAVKRVRNHPPNPLCTSLLGGALWVPQNSSFVSAAAVQLLPAASPTTSPADI